MEQLTNERIQNWVSAIIISIMMIFMVSILVRVATKQIMIDGMGINNSFTKLVFFDSSKELVDNVEVEEIDWGQLYPFREQDAVTDRQVKSNEIIAEEPIFTIRLTKDNNSYMNLLLRLEEKVEFYTSDLLIGQEYMSNIIRKYNDLINWKWGTTRIDNMSSILFMENGYLAYNQSKIPDEEIEEIANSVEDFSNYLELRGIPYIYINTGSKINPFDKQLSIYDRNMEYTNENGDALLAALSERNIAYMDMRQEINIAGLDWYTCYYKTDHHWTTETQLWAAGVIAKKLNEIADFDYDEYYFQENSYMMTVHKNAMFGTQGESATRANVCTEDYTEIQPAFETRFRMQIPTKSFDEEGTYTDVLFNKNHLDEVLQMQNGSLYDCIRYRNDALAVIENYTSTNNSGKKLLVLTDSFGWYLTTYLACDIEEIHIIYPQKFDGSIHTYIESMQPDAVIVMYAECNILPVDWERHSTFFDFR